MPCRDQRVRRRRGGQVLVIAILAMTLLVTLVFYVYNIGDQVGERLAMQNAADAAAVSGAGWIARSMNTTAMNNVAISRLLGILPVMDAFPLASRMALEEVTEWEEGIGRQVAALESFLGSHPMPALKNCLPGMKEMRNRMARQRDILRPFKEAIGGSSFSMDTVTYWRAPGFGGPAPHGSLWRAAKALDDYSQATMDSAGVLAQHNARQFGRGDRADVAILIPLVPEPPHRRGTLDDFQPVLEGQITVNARERTGSMKRTGGAGGGIPDFAYYHRLGPWARLLPKDPWRNYYGHYTGSKQVWRGGHDARRAVQARGGRGSLPGRGSSARRGSSSGRQAAEGRWATVGTDFVIDGYRTRGPYWWALHHIVRRYTDYLRTSRLADTKFGPYMTQVSSIKLGYMFPAATAKVLKTIHYPVWETDYDKALALSQQPEVKITETMLYFFDIASSVPQNSPNFLSPGTFVTNGSLALAARRSGWHDAAKFRPDAQKVLNHIWQSTDQYEITEYPEIGIRYEEDPNTGEPVFHDVYIIEFCMFGAIDIGGDWEVANPCNWNSDEVDDLPAPLLLDTGAGDYDPDHTDVDSNYRREFFGFLSLIRLDSEAAVWPDRFRGVNPTRSIITLAQAKVFNNKSWGLWTQDWQVQLTKLNNWADWVRRIEDDLPNVASTNGAVHSDDLRDILEYLQAIHPDLADRFIEH